MSTGFFATFEVHIRHYEGLNLGPVPSTVPLSDGPQAFNHFAFSGLFIPEADMSSAAVPEASTLAGAGVVAGLAAWTGWRRRRMAA